MADHQWEVENRHANAHMLIENARSTSNAHSLRTQGGQRLKNEFKLRCLFAGYLSHFAAIKSISARMPAGIDGRPQESQHNARASQIQCSLFFNGLRRFVEFIFVNNWASQYFSTNPRLWRKTRLLEMHRFGRGNSLTN